MTHPGNNQDGALLILAEQFFALQAEMTELNKRLHNGQLSASALEIIGDEIIARGSRATDIARSMCQLRAVAPEAIKAKARVVMTLLGEYCEDLRSPRDEEEIELALSMVLDIISDGSNCRN